MESAMVELGNIALKEDLISVIDQAIDAGLDAETFANMVAERIDMRHPVDDRLAADTVSAGAGDILYESGDLPPGLISLPAAAEVYRRPVGTLRQAVRNGKVRRMGRQKGAAPGGYVVVSRAELEAWLAAPKNKGGRPRKNRY